MKIPFSCRTSLTFVLLSLCISCSSAVTACKSTKEMVDCSHLKLAQIPSDLPSNMTALDISHNQLKTLPSVNLTKYNQLIYLNAGFNTISKLDSELCLTLPLLKVLKLEHNQLHALPENGFNDCNNLKKLNLGSNILEIKNDPFKSLKNLTFLDVSHNHLSSAKLGSRQQLEGLQELVISENKIRELRKEDLDFLSNSSLNRLDLSSNPLNKFHPGCFLAIGALYGLLLNNVPLGPNRTAELCSELSGTRIQNLTLNHVQLSSIFNSTFNRMNTTNLTLLDLSNNDLSGIENGSLVYFGRLKHLILKNNKIKHLFSHSFHGLHSLRYLNLVNSDIRKVDDFALQWLKQLEHLVMDGNKLLEITSNIFKGLDNLKSLSLTQCNVTCVKNTTFLFLANSSLEFLNLTKTGLTSIKARAFSCLNQLKILDLGLNNMKQNLTGNEFEGLHSIEFLYLSYNSQLNLTSESFSFIPSLRKLRLRRVGCSNFDITPSPFRKLSNLTILDIGNNNIANMRSDLFDELRHLEILDMQHNNLARLWKHNNPGGPVLFLKGLQNLHLLDLESNGFDEIPDKAFYGLSQLKSLNLRSNNLNLFPELIFNELTSLKSLFLEKNLITTVEKNVFGMVFTNLEELNMKFNPFDCTCDSLAWFVNWLNKSKTVASDLNDYTCNTPSKYHYHKVLQFDTSPCDNAPFKLVFIVNAGLVLLFTFVALFLHFQGWRIKFLWNVAVNKVFSDRETDRLQRQYEYDAYIIHAKKDKDWVSNNFIPLEEDGEQEIRFCLEERDFEAGVSEFDAIIDSIRRSRKIIFVVTEHLLKDAWCRRFKVHHAIRQAIEQSRDSIILIFQHDIPDYKLNNALCLRRAMFKSRCILEWPIQRDRLGAFYLQLKSALKSSCKVL